MKLPRLNVGAGACTPREEGKINCDLYPGPNIDVVFDATKDWPFADSSIGMIQSNHVLEHLPEPWGFFKEAHRVLAPSPLANLYLRLPYGPSENGFGDMNHLRYYTATSFACLSPDYFEYTKNPQYNGASFPFAVIQIFRAVNPRLRWAMKPVIRRLGVPALDFLWGGYTELVVALRALKSPADIAWWKQWWKEGSGSVPVADVMYKHEYEGREIRKGETPEYVFFT